MKKREIVHTRRSLFTALAIAVLVVAPATAATAAGDEEVAATKTITFMPMTIGGYNEEVANANGYVIIVNENGIQTSVPVTKEAIAAEQVAASKRESMPGTALLGGAAAKGEAWGDCGGSWVEATKKPGDAVAFSTGFVVFGAATGYWWLVNAHGAITSNGALMQGNGPASGTKTFEGGIGGVVGPGYAIVPVWSNVQMVNGAVCYAGGPTAWFG